MTPDPRVLHAALLEAERNCFAARKIAEEARTRQYWPGSADARVTDAEDAMERFYAAMDVRDQARRAYEAATGMGEIA